MRAPSGCRHVVMERQNWHRRGRALADLGLAARNSPRCVLHAVVHGFRPTRPRARRSNGTSSAAGASGTGKGSAVSGTLRATVRSMEKPRTAKANPAPIALATNSVSAMPKCSASKPQTNDPAVERPVLRQLVDRQRAPAPRAGRRAVRRPGWWHRQRSIRRRTACRAPPAANDASRRAGQCRRRRTGCSRPPCTAAGVAADNWQEHSGRDAADPHHAKDHAVHPRTRPRCSRTSSGSSAQGAAAGTE